VTPRFILSIAVLWDYSSGSEPDVPEWLLHKELRGSAGAARAASALPDGDVAAPCLNLNDEDQLRPLA